MDAFGTAKHSVKPVAAQPPELGADDVLRAIQDKSWGSYNTKVAAWQADSQANIDAFGAYHAASTSNGGQMPAQYAQLADSGAPISLTERADPKAGTTDKAGPTDTGEWARNPGDTQDRPHQNRVTGEKQDQTRTQPNQQNQQSRPDQQNQFQHQVRPGTTNPDGTHADSYVPQPVLPAAQGGYEFGPTGQPVSNLTGTGTGTNWPGGFGPGSGPYSGGGYPTGIPGTGAGTGSGPGLRGPGDAPGNGPRGGPGSSGPGSGRGPGSSTGARLPEERLPGANPARGSAGPRGANGLPMGAPVAGRGGKEEDREKKTAPYLRNPDPDETFGGFTEKPMPPVIGENKKR